MMKVGFIGTGNIATAMIPKIIENRFTESNNIYIYDIDTNKTNELNEKYHTTITKNAVELVEECDLVVLSIKPYVIKNIISEIKNSIQNQMIISPAAGISLNELEREFDSKVKLSRIMPNLGAIVGQSMTAYHNKNLSVTEEKILNNFLSSFGKSINIEESLFDSFTALSGSSPAFFALYIQAMVEYGVSKGFDIDQAREIVNYTMLSTANLLLNTKFNETTLMNTVSTKGGTTEAGINAFNELNFRSIVKESLDAAANKSIDIKNNLL